VARILLFDKWKQRMGVINCPNRLLIRSEWGDLIMKEVTLKLTDDQVEVLNSISNMCGKSSTDFIRDTVFTILPLNEYIAIKRYLNVAQKLKGKKENKKVIKTIAATVSDIQLSANARLKRIGVL